MHQLLTDGRRILVTVLAWTGDSHHRRYRAVAVTVASPQNHLGGYHISVNLRTTCCSHNEYDPATCVLGD